MKTVKGKELKKTKKNFDYSLTSRSGLPNVKGFDIGPPESYPNPNPLSL